MSEHIHAFKLKNKAVLLGEYRAEDGEMKYVNTSAKDILKQYVCECGKVETVDLTRRKV